MSRKLTTIALVAILLVSACGSAENGTGASTTITSPTAETTPSTVPPTSARPTTQADRDLPVSTGVGQIAIRFEEVQGVFIEGFEAGIRIETVEGETLYATLWTDFVQGQDNPNITDYYESVLIRAVPATEIVVLATVNVGRGPAPVTPDITGEMACRLVLDVPADGVVEIELAFNGTENCLSVTNVS